MAFDEANTKTIFGKEGADAYSHPTIQQQKNAFSILAATYIALYNQQNFLFCQANKHMEQYIYIYSKRNSTYIIFFMCIGSFQVAPSSSEPNFYCVVQRT